MKFDSCDEAPVKVMAVGWLYAVWARWSYRAVVTHASIPQRQRHGYADVFEMGQLVLG